MDRKQMEEYFKMVGFDPDSAGSGSSSDSGASNGTASSNGGSHRPHRRRGGNPFSGFGGFGGQEPTAEPVQDVQVPDIELPVWGRRALTVAVIVLVLIIAFLYWWFHPPINIHSADCWWFLAICVLLPSFITFRVLSRSYATGTEKRPQSDAKSKRFRRASAVPAIVAIIGLLGWVASFSIWPGNAERYSELLSIKDSDFASDIQEVDYNSIPVIDRDSAILLGNRTLGEIPDYVSQFEIANTYSQINYQGRPVRTSPLNYADLFKWFYNKDTGIPAYVLVDMASQDTQVVRLDEPMYYSESEPLERNIDRYVQLKYPFYMFETKSFEIDEDGHPWWVCPVQTRTIGLFGGETISRVVLVDACSGECQDYAIEDCPQWVDRAYPSDLVVQQYNWYGSLHNGWLNSWLGQSGVVQTTPGSDGNLGYNYIVKDDDVWLYTGVTSATSDNAIVGFVLINQRTAETHFYSVAGATEDSAMASAEGQVQNLKYEATFPLLLNINGQPTYFMALKDSAGLVKKYAMIDIQRYQNVAIGDTVEECQKSYKALLSSNGVASGGDDDTGAQEAQGTIRTIAQAVIDGNTHFYLTLDGDSHIYDCTLPAMIEVVGYKVGDTIDLTYIEGDPTSAVQSINGASPDGASETAKEGNDVQGNQGQSQNDQQTDQQNQQSDAPRNDSQQANAQPSNDTTMPGSRGQTA